MASTAQPAYGGTVLRRGAQGPDVALVQEWLNAARARYPELPALAVDGKLGPDTVAAVRAYQKLVGLAQDGAVGPKTWDSLYGTYASLRGGGEIWPGITMRQGSRGATVRSAQRMLQAMMPGLAADGIYGVKTAEAVTAYQILHGLADDGLLGHKTWCSLYGA